MKKRPRALFAGFVVLIVAILGIGILTLMGPAVGNIYGSPAARTGSSMSPLIPSAQQQVPTPTPNLVQRDSTTSIQPQTPQRVILRNANITITVDDPGAKIDEIMNMANEMGGWVVSSNTNTYTNSAGQDVDRGNVTVRVPAERLDEALERIKSGALKVNSESITGQDVTQDYVDTASRLENLKASERQLQAIMETAEKVEDVLAVQTELTNVRSEIEILQGRINYFDEASAFSAISVNVQPPDPGPVERQNAVWNPASTAENAVGTLVRVVQFLVDAGINLVIVVLPFVILLGIPVWVIRRRRQRTAT